MALKFVFALLLAYSAHALKCYNRTFTVFSNDAELQALDSEGLRGRYTGLWSDYTHRKEISFQVWFLSYDGVRSVSAQSFFLSVVAIRKPGPQGRRRELYKPTILWSANRNQEEFVGKNATLTFGTDGNLKLEDSGNRVWSTNTANLGVQSLCVSDWGSIVLLNSSENIVWDSSDQPSDTIPLQKAFKTGSRLVSWTSTHNSSEGPYSLVMESNRLALYFQSYPYWALDFSGELEQQASVYSVFCWQRDGLVTIDLRTNFSQVQENGLMAPESCGDGSPEDQRMPLAVNGTNITYFNFIRLQSDGDLVLYNWNSEQNYWYAAYNLSSTAKCFLPRSCGLYGLCDKQTGKCQDSCPPTFQMTSTGCNPPAELDNAACGQQIRFVQQNQRDYFCSNYGGATFPCKQQEDCENSCKYNCSCKAAFYRNNTCFQTSSEVQSLQTGDYTAFLKVADNQRSSSHHKYYIIAIIMLSAVVLLLLACLWKCRRKDRRHQDLETITSNFSHRIGAGGYGCVFKGQLLDGAEVAVKKLEGSKTSSKDFYAELVVLARTNHLNLVNLLGFCAQGSRRLLIYEYMAKGSLEKWIFQDNNKHEECAEMIIHMDLKPENVLLDNAFEPKIADFGLSKLMDRDVSYLQMTTMRGTPGYLAPECLQEGTLTDKSDVFSFGILLLEIATGCQSKNITSDYLHSATSNHLPEETEKNKWTLIAFLCVQDDPSSRPPMSKVVQMLEGLIEVPAQPPESDLHFFLAYRSKMKPGSSARLNSSSSARMKQFLATSSGIGNSAFIKIKIKHECVLYSELIHPKHHQRPYLQHFPFFYSP